MLEMLQMGKYGPYVWSSYGIALFIMVYVAIKPLMDKKTMFKELMMKYRREEHQLASNQQEQEQS
ncbi:MAG: heme exporter protein CcmD [Gammaproteobacteria bacterium]|nr:heme exporter protein CcmD [Gammaproteobacteria bacterium]